MAPYIALLVVEGMIAVMAGSLAGLSRRRDSRRFRERINAYGIHAK